MQLLEIISLGHETRYRKKIESFLLNEKWANLYLLGELQKGNTGNSFSLVLDDENINSVMLRVNLREYPVFWITGNLNGSQLLLDELNEDKFVLLCENNIEQGIRQKFDQVKIYREHVMHLNLESFNDYGYKNVKKLTVKDAGELATSLNNGNPPDRKQIQDAEEQVESFDSYGLFNGERMISRGRFDIKSEYGWAIGKVYTEDECRGRGYATSLLSSMIQNAAQYSEDFALFVRSDNDPAIRCYEKLGFEKCYNRLFIDLNTGQKP